MAAWCIYLFADGRGVRIIGRDWDLDDNGWLDVVLTSEGSYRVDIYWNNATGFNIANKTQLFTKGPNPQGVSLCDLDRDGTIEVLVGERDEYLAYIYKYISNSYIKSDSVKVPWGNQHLKLADLNNDGEIDIITSATHWSYIYYGPGSFYSMPPADSLYIPQASPGSAHRVTVADLNYDEWLDIIMSSQPGNLYIYWGSSTGWDSSTVLLCEPNWDHSIADLNKDGYLDIFINHHNSGNDIIYYGSSSGFVTNDTPGNGTGNCSIFDINSDGELDIAASQLIADVGYIIWGPNYTVYISLPCPGSDLCVTEVADFDNDLDIDVLFGATSGQSHLYWNNGGFSPTNRFTFPNPSNDAIWEDLGNLWDRSNKERYLSSVFEANDTIKVDSVRWWGNFPAGIDVKLWMRGALDTNSWNQWVVLTNGGTDSSIYEISYLQYRCVFSTDYKLTSIFSFDSIKVYYDTLPVGVNLEPNVSRLDVWSYPNPIRVGTRHGVSLQFSLPEDGILNLTIYNLTGEKIRILIVNRYYPRGFHKLVWDATNEYGRKIPSGMYFYTLGFTGDKERSRITKKLIVYQ